LGVKAPASGYTLWHGNVWKEIQGEIKGKIWNKEVRRARISKIKKT
jgi:hypothetical protein